MRFKKIYIEITNRCNLNCDFCQPHLRDLAFMEPEAFSYIIKQISPYTKYIYLHVMGEPLLHPQLETLLLIAKEAGMQVNMTSNCVLLPKKVDCLKGKLRQLNMSLHSKVKQDGIHQNSYVEDCLNAGDILAESGVYISYRMWNMKQHTLDEESKALLQMIEHHYKITIDTKTHRKLAPHRFLHFEETFAWPSIHLPQISKTGSCYGMRSMCAILVDGSVVPCCLDGRGDCTLGNIFSTSFLDIISSIRCQNMVEGFQKQQIIEPLCQRCGYRGRFDEEVIK